jgi:hypothetical protein
MGVQKHYKKRFAKKNVEKLLQKNRPKTQNRWCQNDVQQVFTKQAKKSQSHIAVPLKASPF